MEEDIDDDSEYDDEVEVTDGSGHKASPKP